jgi:quinol monooxygenase YgiN
MKAKQVFWASMLVGACCFFMSPSALAFPSQEPLVRLAELEIDPAQLDAYESALKEEISASIRLEPGVLRLSAVSIKDHPNQIRLFEMYRDQASYQAPLSSPHFKRYTLATQHMIKSLTLIETEPAAARRSLRN